MDNALAHNLPAHLTKYMSEEQHDDLGALTPADFGIGFIKIGHGQSREAKPGPNGEAAVPPGVMFISRDRTLVPEGTPFIPLCRSVTYIKWEGRPGDGHMEFSTRDPEDKRIKAIKGLDFTKDPRTGKNLAPLVTTYVNFYVMLKGCEEPLLLSFHRTSIPIGRKLTQELFRSTKNNRLKLFTTLFTLNKPIPKRDGSNEWHQFNPVFAMYTPPEAIEAAERMYDLAIALRDASSGAEFTTIEDEPEDDDAPSTIQAEARVIHTPAPQQLQTPPPMQNVTPPQTQQQQAPAPHVAAPGGKLW